MRRNKKIDVKNGLRIRWITFYEMRKLTQSESQDRGVHQPDRLILDRNFEQAAMNFWISGILGILKKYQEIRH
jgi:hypothetical protein